MSVPPDDAARPAGDVTDQWSLQIMSAGGTADGQVLGQAADGRSPPMAATGPGRRRSYQVADLTTKYRGGYGVVFEAELVDDHLGASIPGQRVALKELSGIDDDRWIKLVARSPELARLSHPGLAVHLEVFDAHPLALAPLGPGEPMLHWTANEWVPGRPLADAVQGMTACRVLDLFAGAGEAIDFLHRAGVAHRDLHPRNLIVTDDDRLVVIDYDTALTAGSQTTTRMIAGTRFTADLPEAARFDPLLADDVAFARCAVHALAGDGNGALEDEDAVDLALRASRQHLADPDRFAALLRRGLAGTRGGCAAWVRELRAAATTPPRRLARPARALGRITWRRSTVIYAAVSSVLLVLAFVNLRESDGNRQRDLDASSFLAGDSARTIDGVPHTSDPESPAGSSSAVPRGAASGPAPMDQGSTTSLPPPQGPAGLTNPSDTKQRPTSDRGGPAPIVGTEAPGTASTTPARTVGPITGSPTTVAAPTYPQQVWSNSGVGTFTNPHDATGAGLRIPAGAWVEVTCKVYAPEIESVNPDGYWYRIASAPWNNEFYSPANTFWNGDVPGEPATRATDFAVPDCPG